MYITFLAIAGLGLIGEHLYTMIENSIGNDVRARNAKILSRQHHGILDPLPPYVNRISMFEKGMKALGLNRGAIK